MRDYVGDNSSQFRIKTDQSPREFVEAWGAGISVLNGNYEIKEITTDVFEVVCVRGGNVVATMECKSIIHNIPPQFRRDYSRFGISELSLKCFVNKYRSTIYRLMIEWLNNNTCNAVYDEYETSIFV